METYHLEVAGLERELPVCPLGNGVSIAGFVMFSDVELTIACATELLKRVPEHDVLLTAESKESRWRMRCPARAENGTSLPERAKSCT